MQVVKEQVSGRVLVLRWEGVLDGSGPTPEQVFASAQRRHARFLLLDTTDVPYADSDGLRWLRRLRDVMEERGHSLRIAARPQGRVWRSLSLVQIDLDVYASARQAWKTPWRHEAANDSTPERD